MKREKKYMSGILLLTLSAAAAKICGVVYKIPLYAVIGEEGMGYFNSAYVIYTFFFVFTTSGLPVGLSILVARSFSEKERRTWLNKALALFGVCGAVICVLMMLFPRRFALLIGNEGAAPSIFMLGPTLFAVCVEGALRGYFQGKKNMLPTAVSQLLEALGKTTLGLYLAGHAVKTGLGTEVAAAMGLSGIAIGSLLGLLYLLICFYLDYRKNKNEESVILSFSKPKASTLLKIVLPVSATAVILSISSVIDLSILMHRLHDIGYSAAEANSIYGVFSGLAIPMFNLPSVLISPIASAVVPHLSLAASDKDTKVISFLSEASLRMAMLVSLPCFAGFAVLSESLLSLLFDQTSAESAAPLLTILAPSVPLVAVVTVAGAILQATGKGRLPVIAITSGSVVKIASSYFLVGACGVNGAPIGTFLCYLTASAILIYAMIVDQRFHISISKTIVYPFIASLFCGVTAKLTSLFLPIQNVVIKTLFSVFLAAVVYLMFVCLSGAVDEEILSVFPKGKRIYQILTKRKLLKTWKKKQEN